VNCNGRVNDDMPRDWFPYVLAVAAAIAVAVGFCVLAAIHPRDERRGLRTAAAACWSAT
jgi:hypothetical protein